MLKTIHVGMLVWLCGVGIVGDVWSAAGLPGDIGQLPSYNKTMSVVAVELKCENCSYVNFNDDFQVCNRCGIRLKACIELSPESAQKIGAQICESAAGGENGYLQKMLRKYPLFVDYVDKAGNTPLLWAVGQNGTVETVNLLVKARAYVDARTLEFEVTPLMIASRFGKKDIVEALLDASASINLRNKFGCTVLCAAIDSEHQEIVSLLLRKKADPTIGLFANGGIPLLHVAATKQHAMVQLLLEEGGAERQMNAKLHTGESIVLATMADHGDEDIFRLLLRYGAHTVNDQNKSGVAPLTYAAEKNYLGVLGLLLEAKAVVDVQSTGGMTALMYAAFHGKKEAAVALLAAGAHVGVQCNHEKTARLYAEEKGHVEIAEILAAAEERERREKEKLGERVHAEV